MKKIILMVTFLLCIVTSVQAADITASISIGYDTTEFDREHEVADTEASDYHNYNISGWVAYPLLSQVEAVAKFNYLDPDLEGVSARDEGYDVNIDDSFNKGYSVGGGFIIDVTERFDAYVGLDYAFVEEKEETEDSEGRDVGYTFDREILNFEAQLAYSLPHATFITRWGAVNNEHVENGEYDEDGNTHAYHVDNIHYLGFQFENAFSDSFSMGFDTVFFNGTQKDEDGGNTDGVEGNIFTIYSKYDFDNYNLALTTGYKRYHLDEDQENGQDKAEGHSLFAKLTYTFNKPNTSRAKRMMLDDNSDFIWFEGTATGMLN